MTTRKKELEELRGKIEWLEHLLEYRDKDIEDLYKDNSKLRDELEKARKNAEKQLHIAESAIHVNDLLCADLRKDNDFFVALRAALLLLEGKTEIRQTFRESEA